MKRLTQRIPSVIVVLAVAILLLLPVPAAAEGTVSDPVPEITGDYMSLSFTVTADASTGSVPQTAFTHALGQYFYQLKTASATDDTYAVSLVEMITDTLSVPVMSKTVTTGTDGAQGWPAGYSLITGTLKIDVTDLAPGESCTVVLIFLR